ncbi:MAG: type I restriction endonuclease subunit R [Paludibacteraceae bacterium]|nr:type I restriction endonuclease subunit R [Paludibacteraceae bacterium]
MFNEATLEAAIMQLFEEKEKYTHKLGEQLHKNLAEVLLIEDIESYLKSQYSDITEDEIQRAVFTLKAQQTQSLYEENKRVLNMIVEGFPLKRDDAKKPPLWIRLIDFENPTKNDFKIVNQVEIVEVCNRRPDAIVYVNGLPLVVMEFKSAVKEHCTVKDAFTQLTVRYRKDISSLFRYNAFVVISDGVQNKFGTLFTPYEYFYPWKKVEPEDSPSDGIQSLFTMISGLFRKERLLEVVKNFIYFPDSSTKEEKLVCRYPQFFAATMLYENILKHHKIGDGKGGTYFGATGCGKSLAMLFLARMLMRSSALQSPTILLITDRTDLDNQLSGQFTEAKKFIGDETIEQIESREILKERLNGRKSGGVFLTTIQKFSEDISLLTDRKNVICISDEAHRTQTNLEESTVIKFNEDGLAVAIKKTYGFAQYLHQSLPNAIYVGFTGTPIDETIAVFGGVIDKYTMTDSVNDGITVRIVYEGRAAKVFADNEKLQLIDKYYEECAEAGSTIEQINRSKQQSATMEAIIGDSKRLQRIAEDLVAHYEQRIAEGATVCGKAMIVCTSRQIAFDLYKKIIALRPDWTKKQPCDPNFSFSEEDKLLPLERIKMVMTENKDDEQDLAKLLGNKADRQEWAEQFKKDKSNFKIVIVVDMWLTGFDVPSLDTMYIDKPLQKHTLIQTISRVNRVCPGKEKGLVVDYLGIKKSMNKAMKIYGGGSGQGEDNGIIVDPLFPEIDEFVKIVKDEIEILDSIIYGYDYTNFFANDPVLQLQTLNGGANFVLETESRKNLFMGHAKVMRQAFNMCSSSEEWVKELREKILFFTAVRSIVFKMTKGDAPDVAEMNAKVRKLVEDALESEGVEEVVKIIESANGTLDIFDSKHLALVDKIPLPNIRLNMLERLAKRQISEFGKVNKVKAIEFVERLNNIIIAYNDRSDDIANVTDVMKHVVDKIKDMMKDLSEERKSHEKLGIDYEEKAFYDILKAVRDERGFEYEDAKMVEMAKAMKAMIADKSHFTDCFKRSDIMAEMQFQLIVIMSNFGYPPAKDNPEDVYSKVLEQAENFKKYE